MARKPSRQERKNTVNALVMFPIIMIGIILIMNGITNLYLLGGIFIAGIITSVFAQGFVPDLRKKENRNKNAYTGLPQNKQHKSPKKTSISKNNERTTLKKTKKNLTDTQIIASEFSELDGFQFERLCYLYFKDLGFKPRETPPSGDHGVDLIITDPKDGLDIAVQIKNYSPSNTVGNNDLIKLMGGKRAYKCPGTLFITTSSYTNKALEFATESKMEIWNGLIVDQKIGKWRKKKLKKIG
ncbi:restriction endonuclease [Bacillus salitolerans]|uniref:Restriction endonuclease n=1 Tax=Bacillus salitolerans TaxID=1437434 RepID=A0ABW4LLR5_9BACI